MLVPLGLVTIGVSSCAYSPMTSPLENHLDEIRSSSAPPHQERDFTLAEKAYFAHYELDPFEAADHRFGYQRCGDRRIALHWYESPDPRRVVVVSHGYYDHSGTWKQAIPALLEAGNTVVIYDHPGHGLSDGERASIGDFREYVDVLGDVLDDCRSRTRLPIVLAGHSMGCSVIAEYLLDRDRAFAPFRTVLVAPLVRPTAWGTSRFAHAALSWAVPSVPRLSQNNSSDPAYLEFVREDPLHHRALPLEWLGALFAWNERAAEFVPVENRSIRILQGSRDGTVQWEYNVDFLMRKFPDATLRMFPEGRHQLLNEAEPLRSEVLRELIDAVGGD